MLALALLGVAAAYLASLNDPLYSDDYIYLNAARELSFGHYARLSLTPWSIDSRLPFTRDYWRPSAFLYFEVAQPVFGGRVLPYHLVNLGVHASATVLTWLIARRLDRRPVVAAVAALAFAFYPGSNEAVAWISSVNGAGLPIMLGSWLLFLSATEGDGARRGRLIGSAALFAVAMSFRETSAILLGPLVLWYLLVQARPRLRERRTYAVFVPLLAVGVAYFVVRTRFLSEPAANPDIYGIDHRFDNRLWYYLKNVLLPFRDPVLGWRREAQAVSGAVLLATIPIALVSRRWGLLALTMALVASFAPLAAALLGVGLRYLYFSTPILALGLGLVAADVHAWAERRLPRRPLAGIAAAAVIVAAGVGVFLVYDRNDNWAEVGPEREQEWVDELRAAFPVLPAGGTLYCSNVPLTLVLFEAANLFPTVHWYYPDLEAARLVRQDEPAPPLGPDDRFFIASGGLPASATPAQP